MLTQNLDNLAGRLGTHSRLAQDINNHILTMNRITHMLFGHQHFVIDAGVFWHHIGNAAFVKEAPYRLLRAMFYHINNNAFTPATVVDPVYPGSYPVAVKHLAHLPSGEKKIRSAIVRHKKTEAIFVANNPTTNQIGRV